MEPRIQYARTEDGANIAFYAVGQGNPLVVMPSMPVSHIEQELRIPEWRDWYERLGQDRMLVRYDGRGMGLSDRRRLERDLDSMVMDLEAVVEKLKLERFAIQAILYAVPVAVAYAVKHPERVSHLLFFCGFSNWTELNSPQLAAVRTLLERDWDLYTETTAHVLLGWAAGAPAQRFARFIRDSTSKEGVAAQLEARYDVVDLLGKVEAPTLVQHRRNIPWLPIDHSRRLAAGIPNARLEVLEGSSIALYLEDTDSVMRGIDAFLGDRQAAVARTAAGLQTILFTDLLNHDDLLNRLGDQRGRELLREHERITRDALRARGGREVKAMGGGFLASFPSAQRALETATDMQRAFAAWNAAHPEDLLVRIGINAGEPISENDDLFGESVIAASRIASRAEGGQVLVSNVVRELVTGRGFQFTDKGEVVLRGFEDPVRLYELSWQP